jgi:hypothetical protein
MPHHVVPGADVTVDFVEPRLITGDGFYASASAPEERDRMPKFVGR